MSNSLSPLKGTLPEVIVNDDALYLGDLKYYFRAIFRHARNLEHPYHNFRHLFHVFWLCYQACLFYRERLSARDMRNLLIAAMFHDFDHSGRAGNDDLNIELAIRGLKKHVAEMDMPYLDEICALIRLTEFPPTSATEPQDLLGEIMRDADMGQTFSVAWIQQVVFGLAREAGIKPIEMLARQKPFLSATKFYTEWGRMMFGPKTIEDKITEAEALLVILSEEETV
ncbi:MAG TPA: HD domain-containing protein [Candidatus Paceibacterota bacterium]